MIKELHIPKEINPTNYFLHLFITTQMDICFFSLTLDIYIYVYQLISFTENKQHFFNSTFSNSALVVMMV